LSTPLSTRHFMNHRRGETYGLSATPERFRLRCLTPRTPIRNLYLTGQDVVTLGVAGALMGGVVTASALLRRNLMSTLAKAAPKEAALLRSRASDPTVAGVSAPITNGTKISRI
jgi:phytoene dehydrogenase-like protein